MSVLNVALDTYGSLLTKEHGVGMTVWEINMIRFGFAGVVMLFVSIPLSTWDFWTARRSRQRHVEDSKNSENEVAEAVVEIDGMDNSCPTEKGVESNDTASDESATPWYALPVHTMSRSAWRNVAGGVVLVTFLTPSLSNYALFEIALALALTLGSISPLYSLPLAYFLQKVVPTPRACLGAALAVAGIAVLAFKGNTVESPS